MVVAITLNEGLKGKIGVVEPVFTTSNHGIELRRNLISGKSTTVPADELSPQTLWSITDGRCESTKHN